MFSRDIKTGPEYRNKTVEELLEKLVSLQERLEKQKEDLDRCSDVERSLRESEEKYRFLVENSKDLIWKIDLQGRWLFVSSNVEAILGYKLDEVIGKTIWDFVAPEYHDILKTNMDRRLLGEERPPYEVAIIAPDGHYMLFEILASVIRDKNGRITGIQGISRDIAYRKQAEERLKRYHEDLETRVRERTSELTKINQVLKKEINEHMLTEEALRESEEKFRVLSETSSAVIYVFQGENLVYVNEAARKITGYSKDELFKMKFWEIVHPEFQELVRERGLARQSDEEAPSRYEVKLITKGGEVRWAEIMAGRIMYMGKPAGVATLIDITERKRVEDRLQLTQFAVDHFTDPSIWMDQSGRIIYVNDAACKSMEYDRKELLSMHIWDIDPTYSPEKYARSWKEWESRQKELKHFESSYCTKSGKIFPVEVTVDFVIFRGKKYLVTYDRDITERKRAEEALSDAKAQAELYLDLMGHDINNLNHVALGYLELANEVIKSGGKLGEDNRELLEKPMISLDSSSKLIDNVMKLRKLKTRELRLEQVDICKILTDLKERYSQVTERDITINYVPPVECLAVANELIDEIFINIIENSIKHSPPDRPLVIDILQTSVCVEGKKFNRVSIEDNGPGIPDDVKEKLFVRFYRGPTLVKGKGLGLYLVKTLVENFGGKVIAEDRVPCDHTKGAKFVVMLPTIDQ
jgi:PAS domain S-box-containing protein